MQKKITYLSQFIKTLIRTDTWRRSLPTASDIPLNVWYQDLATLPLHKFIDVCVTGNLAALVISGFPTKQNLEKAWEAIKLDFSDTLGDNDTRLYFSSLRAITILRLTYTEITELIDILHKIYYEPYAVRLNARLHTNFVFNPDKPEEYHKLLQGCANRAKGIKIDLDLKLMQFEAIQNKQQDGAQGYTREYFISVLITISNHAHFNITDSITVYEFCERLKRYNEHCKELEKMYAKNAR